MADPALAEAYYLSVLSLAEMKHRLAATVCSQAYADGGDALLAPDNKWRIGKDSLRLQRLLELEASGRTTERPRSMAVDAVPTAAPITLEWITAGGRTYCMPAALAPPLPTSSTTVSLLSTSHTPPSTTSSSSTSPSTSPTNSPGVRMPPHSPVDLEGAVAAAAAAVPISAAVLIPITVPAIAAAMRPLMDLASTPLAAAAANALTVYNDRLERVEHCVQRVCANIADRRARYQHMRRKCAQGIAKARGDWKRMRAVCRTEFCDLAASFGAMCASMMVQWVEGEAAHAARVRAAHAEDLATLAARKDAALTETVHVMHDLEAALCQTHQTQTCYQRLAHTHTRAVSLQVQRLALLTNGVALSDFDDMYSITLEKLCCEGVEPFLWVDTLKPADILSTQLELALMRGHRIHSGEWDASPPTKYCMLSGAECVAWEAGTLPSVEAHRANLLAGVKESVLALCLSPPLRRLRDLSLLVDDLCRLASEASTALRAAAIGDKMDLTLIRQSHTVRMKCAGEIHHS